MKNVQLNKWTQKFEKKLLMNPARKILNVLSNVGTLCGRIFHKGISSKIVYDQEFRFFDLVRNPKISTCIKQFPFYTQFMRNLREALNKTDEKIGFCRRAFLIKCRARRAF